MNQQEYLESRRIAGLISGFIHNTITEKESEELDEWIAASDDNMLLFEKLIDRGNLEWSTAWFANLNVDAALDKTIAKGGWSKHERKKTKQPYYYAAAAILLIALGLTVYQLYFAKDSIAREKGIAEKSTIISPGYTKAFLINDKGERFDLSQAINNTISADGFVIAENNGKILSYDNQANVEEWHTIEIPRGGEYQIILADGTKAWLNAMSRLRFPTKFTGNVRRVELSGEGYFEVEKNAAQAFMVAHEKVAVEVLGTKFQMSVYPDDGQTVSLFEGSVRVNAATGKQLLAPGELAMINHQRIQVVKPLHIEDQIAWTKGIFSFRNSSIVEVMEQVSRWYDIEVRYEGKINRKLTGQIYRNSTFKQVIEILKSSGGIAFDVDGKQITVKALK